MEDIGHSPLLKFFVAGRKIPNMSEPDFKIQVPLDDSNITSTVPEEQKLRDVATESNFTDVPGERMKENATDIVGNTSKVNAKDEAHEKGDSTTETNKEDFVLTPVVTITKEEAVFTKGDLKLQKVSVTEDISGIITTTIGQKNVSVINNGGLEMQTEGYSVQQIRTETQTNEKELTETKKPKTRIPTLRFRQAVDQLKQDRNSFEDKKEPQTPQPQLHTPHRSAIPRLKDGRSPAPSIQESTPQNAQTAYAPPRLSDEFDKLYDEIAEDQDSLDNLSISSKVEDPVKIDNTFEEIIHAYEEDKIQTINTEKVKQSKIPLLKRKSEHEIEVPKQNSSVNRESISVDFSTIKTSGTVTENQSKIQSVTLNKSPIRTNLISKRISEIKSVQGSSTGHLESFMTLNVEESNKTESNIIKKEISKEVFNKATKVNEIKENITTMGTIETGKITSPILEYTTENFQSKMKSDTNKAVIYEAKSVESVQEQNIFTQKEDNVINLKTSTNTTIQNVQKESLRNINTIKIENIEKKSDKEVFNKATNVSEVKENITTMGTIESEKIASPISEYTNENFQSRMKTDTIKAVMYEAKSVESIQEQNIFTQKEDKVINLKTSTNTTVQNVQKESLRNINTIKIENIEKKSDTELLSETKNEEDIPVLKGKVNRIINRMDSKEQELKQSKRDFEDDILMEKTVLSKIAMFEQPKPADITSKQKNIIETSINPIKSDTKHDLTNKPYVVEEALKILPAAGPLVMEPNKDNNINNPRETNNSGPGTKCDPKYNENTLFIEIADIQTHEGGQGIGAVEITSNNTEENISPLISVHPEKSYDNNITTQDVSIDNGNTFDIQIVDIQPKVLVQSPLENKLNNFERKDLNSTNIQKTYFRLEQVESAVSSSSATLDHYQGYINNNQTTTSNINDNRHNIQVIDSRPEFVEIGTQWKTERNTSEDKKNNTTYYENLNLKESIIADSRPEIVSGIIKQEVQVQHVRVDDHKKIIENGIFHRKTRKDEGQLRIHSYRNNEPDQKVKSSSLAELDLGDAIRGRVKNIIVRMKSMDRLDAEKKEIIDIKERPRKKSVSEKIALFERKLTPIKFGKNEPAKFEQKVVPEKCAISEEEYTKKIEELSLAKTKYGVVAPGNMKYLELRDGGKMPAVGIGTALLDPKLTRHVIEAAIDLGYRTIDTAYIYGNEKEVGEAINEKIKDGTVLRSELFIISKLWSTFHRRDLVQRACRASLDAMGLDYFDLYLIHNPMSFKEGGDPLPKIANVLQFSEHDYLDAWFGVERLVREGLVKRGGVSNFNSQQVDRVVEKGKIKPVVNQVECHPYLSQHRLDEFCQVRNVKLCCYGVLGSKGTPQEYKSALPPAIDDPLIRVMAAGLDVSPAALLISYQLALDRCVIVKASNPAHLWGNLQALQFTPGPADVSALHALNRNKRTFTFKGMGDTHRNYPFNIPF